MAFFEYLNNTIHLIGDECHKFDSIEEVIGKWSKINLNPSDKILYQLPYLSIPILLALNHPENKVTVDAD